MKVTVLLEELLALGRNGAEYDAWPIDIGQREQRGSGSSSTWRRSSSRSCRRGRRRAECFSWLFWQMGSAPYLDGGFGRFCAYAPENYEYPTNRYAMEGKRQLDVLDRNLAERRYLCGDECTIADIATFPWYGGLVMGRLCDAAEFLDVASCRHVVRWASEIAVRDAVRRGERVNQTWGPEELRVAERHDAADLG